MEFVVKGFMKGLESIQQLGEGAFSDFDLMHCQAALFTGTSVVAQERSDPNKHFTH